jgi:hypothetical protein
MVGAVKILSAKSWKGHFLLQSHTGKKANPPGAYHFGLISECWSSGVLE